MAATLRHTILSSCDLWPKARSSPEVQAERNITINPYVVEIVHVEGCARSSYAKGDLKRPGQ